MKACFLVVLLAFGAALAAEEASDATPDAAPKKARQLAAHPQAAHPQAAYPQAGFSQAGYTGYSGYPAGAYYQEAPAQAFANGPYYSAAPASYYQGSYPTPSSSYYPGAYSGAYSGSYSDAFYPGSSGAPASFYSASPYYGGAQFASNDAFKPAYTQSVLPAPVYKAAAPAPAFAAPVYKAAAPAPAFAAPVYKAAAPAPAFAAPAFNAVTPVPAFAAPVFKAATPAPAFPAPVKAYAPAAYARPAAYAAPAAYATHPNSVILKQVLDSNFDGSFTSSYETDQGQVVDSRGFMKNAGTPDEVQVVQGSYSYISPEGQPITTYYIADENGFRVQGDHLPQAQEIPEAIAKSLAYQASLPAQPEPEYVPAASSPAVILAKKAL